MLQKFTKRQREKTWFEELKRQEQLAKQYRDIPEAHFIDKTLEYIDSLQNLAERANLMTTALDALRTANGAAAYIIHLQHARKRGVDIRQDYEIKPD